MQAYLLAGLSSFLLSTLTCLLLIPFLRKFKAGQNIHNCVKEHANKSGTPTMGGLAFVLAATLCCVLFVADKSRHLIVSIAIGNAYMLVGLLDDLLKKHHRENQGLKSYQKFFFQLIVAVVAGVYCLRQNLTTLTIPFFNQKLYIGGWIVPLAAFIFVGTVNAVNLTDGLDGLAAGVSTPFFFCFGLLLCLQGKIDGLETLCFCLTGVLCGYLIFNVPKASLFMGDTGSLALGGFASCIGIFTGNALYIAVMGVMFVLSIISVVIQVIYYKATGGKRVFLMSPIHHHFQQKGFSESKISFTYAMITAIMGLLCLLFAV